MGQVTLESLRNPKRASGYNYIHIVGLHKGKTGTPKFTAMAGTRPHSKTEKTNSWIGPRRATAKEAAQDYCDYVNGNNITLPPKLKDAGHTGSRRPLPLDEELEAALGVLKDAKAQREGAPAFVYCIGEEGSSFVKVGYSTNPGARIRELQSGNPRKLKLIGTIDAVEREETERQMHVKYIKQNVLGEWFISTPGLLKEFND